MKSVACVREKAIYIKGSQNYLVSVVREITASSRDTHRLEEALNFSASNRDAHVLKTLSTFQSCI